MYAGIEQFELHSAYPPVKDPRVEGYVGIHDPNTDGSGAHGGAHAAPVFKRIVEDVLKHMNVPADVKVL